MATALQWLDVAFAAWLGVTARLSLVVIVVLAARAALRRCLSASARYALWLLLAVPLVAPLLPAPVLPWPEVFRSATDATRPTAPDTDAPTTYTGSWKVEYGLISSATGSHAIAPATAIPRNPVNWLRVAASVWVIGVALLLGRIALLQTQALRLVRRSPAVEDDTALALLVECAKSVGVRRPPLLVDAPAGSGPALLGVFRPTLLLPADATSFLSRDELRFVFLHELVHQKRCDVLAEWILALLQIAHWFNPLVWLAAARCRADREIACDASVLALTGDADRGNYGRTILRLATELVTSGRRPHLAAAAIGILENRTPLERRLRMIASYTARRRLRWPAAVIALATLAMVAFCNAQAPETDNFAGAKEAIRRGTELQREQAIEAAKDEAAAKTAADTTRDSANPDNTNVDTRRENSPPTAIAGPATAADAEKLRGSPKTVGRCGGEADSETCLVRDAQRQESGLHGITPGRGRGHPAPPQARPGKREPRQCERRGADAEARPPTPGNRLRRPELQRCH